MALRTQVNPFTINSFLIRLTNKFSAEKHVIVQELEIEGSWFL